MIQALIDSNFGQFVLVATYVVIGLFLAAHVSLLAVGVDRTRGTRRFRLYLLVLVPLSVVLLPLIAVTYLLVNVVLSFGSPDQPVDRPSGK